jgi:hypothetical protein
VGGQHAPKGYEMKKTLVSLLAGISVMMRDRVKKGPDHISAGSWLTIAALLGLLALASWTMYRLWGSIEVDMPTWAWAALGFGVGLSLLVGFGLMALLFYSSRMGYDEPPHAIEKQDPDD